MRYLFESFSQRRVEHAPLVGVQSLKYSASLCYSIFHLFVSGFVHQPLKDSKTISHSLLKGATCAAPTRKNQGQGNQGQGNQGKRIKIQDKRYVIRDTGFNGIKAGFYL